jgi:hypothetical protein
MSEAGTAATDQADDEFGIVFRTLLEERMPRDGRRLDAVSVALLRKCALHLISDDADPSMVLKLLEMAPKPERKRVGPEPTLDEVCAEDRPWSLELLSAEQLAQFEAISCVAQGRACPLVDERVEVGHAIARLLSEAGDRGTVDAMPAGKREELRQKLAGLLDELVSPWRCHEVVHNPAASSSETERLRTQVAKLQDEITWMRQRGPQPLPPATAKEIAAAVADAMAPTMVRSGVERVSEMIGTRPRHLGDHPGW